ncbi:biosynthetic arginine decarboxylase [Paraglaciecola polaris]|uniref:Arginine decarboxylase n=1 Tax=Paraglaciecola polaris LMG 21857 TaxID=1129793 RepID=K6YG86_9ALTE|nr:biosynthetic arginine decarboxylase [Paraglaciecola polaris]GAC31749.1 arginine decarboxylase [Paraglaciecola polaris LMG 21857]|tara:strand:- start:272 stop:2194 length:1923 start_codon:yes stop_codon:yes gene_type:complete
MAEQADWTIDDAERVYGVQRWGAGYFEIGANGNLKITPDLSNKNMRIDFQSVIDEIKQEGIQFPVVVRFHDILRSQVAALNKTFINTIEEAQYQGKYMGVYPVKVNQMREVVEEIVDAGAPFNYGLEAGSKAELITVMAYNTNIDSLTILNGYKDAEFMRLALLGRKLGRKMIVVIEKYSELSLLINAAKQLDVMPIIGLRSKMTVKGRGKWESSGGDRAKFGLTTSEMICAARYLESEGMGECLKLLHFHIGSQLTDIRAVKEAISEGGRIYAEMHRMGFKLEYVDVGGGLGIDYDGSKSTNDSSRNYTMEEYVADVVYGMREVCDLENVPHPTLVSESGRAITAHHSCVVAQVVGEIRANSAELPTDKLPTDHILLNNIRELAESVDSQNNLQEIFNDASQWKEQAIGAFKLRVISLEELGKIETLYWQIMVKLQHRLKDAEFVPEELQELDYNLSSQYLCNFSVFQSAADTWAIDQVLPVVPISRMNEKPTVNCSLVDITCDSDGKLDQFVVDHGISDVLPMPPLKKGEDYYLGLFLTGAYQDVMGDMHNLFGRLNEVHIFGDDDDPEDFYIEEVVKGSSVQDVLSIMQYNPDAMAQSMKRMIDQHISSGAMKPREAVKWTDFYEDCLKGYTYLKTS